MTSLVRFDPFSDLRTTMDRLFDEGFSRPWRLLPQDTDLSFPVDISESEDSVHVKASLPGVKPEDVDITVANDVLTIKAEHKEETEETKKNVYRHEIRYGSFHRSIALPVGVDADRAQARYENGVVSLTLPKAEALRPKQIKVSATS
jgi:HSP20 family protein